MLALPWVALAAAVAGLGKITFDYYRKQAKLNRLLKDSTVTSKELKSAIAEKKTELEKAREKLDSLTDGADTNRRATEAQRKKVAELKRQLEALEGTYNVRIQLEIAAGQIADEVERLAKAAGGKAKGFDQLSADGIREAIARANGTFNEGGSNGSGVGGGSSSVDNLAERIRLSEQALQIQQKELRSLVQMTKSRS